jgi:hypothetical protein
MGGARAYDRASGTVREYRGARMTVAELEARVRRAVE